MGKSKKLACLNLNPIVGILLIVSFISIFVSGPKDQKATKQQEKEKLEIEQKIKAISENECIAKYISTLKVVDDGTMYRIYLLIYPLFVPKSSDQVQTWTDAVCKSSKRILDNYGLVRNISVWAIRPTRISVAGDGWVLFYGATFYDPHTDKFEFKRLKVK